MDDDNLDEPFQMLRLDTIHS